MNQNPPHLHIAVSGHGFGHAAQLAPVVAKLHDAVPGLHVSLAGALPASAATDFFCPLEHHDISPLDVGMVMAGPMRVLRPESFAAYQAFHADWEQRVEAEAARLHALSPDVVLADVPYLTLAGAARAGVPAFALSSLNWAEIFGHYCGAMEGAAEIVETIRAAYNTAQAFLHVAPAMAMPGLGNLRPLGPVARIGVDRKSEILTRAGRSPETWIALFTLGGIAEGAPRPELPEISGVLWVTGDGSGDGGREDNGGRGDILPRASLGLPFIDILASADLVDTKPGYGTFSEAACNGARVLYVPRGDWPEEPALTSWLHENAGLPALGPLRARRTFFWSRS